MSTTYSIVNTKTFTITHARHIVAKIATDLKRMQRLYGDPSDREIAVLKNEAIVLLKAGVLGTVTYGYLRYGFWIEPTLTYTQKELAGISVNDDDPGRIRPGANIAGASFYSYLTYTLAWQNLNEYEKKAIKSCLPFERIEIDEPRINGYLNYDLTYSAGGRALDRATVRSF